MTGPSPTTRPTQAAPRWVKARRSDNANACVEIMLDEAGRYHIRDSKFAPHGPVVTANRAEWQALCVAVTAERPARSTPSRASVVSDSIHVTFGLDGSFSIEQWSSDARGSVVLSFTAQEHLCFVDGIQNGEFTSQALAVL